MDEPEVFVDLPLLDQFLALDDDIRRCFPPTGQQIYEVEGLDILGAFFGKPRTLGSLGYYCDPVNCSCLGSTGGNGVHFNILVRGNQIDETCPVYVTIPSDCGQSFVVADSFTNFLRFGIRRGFFALEQFGFDCNLTLKVYSSADWQPTEEWDYLVGFGQCERHQEVLNFVRDRLKLQPLEYTRQEFDTLQEKYLPLLEFEKKSNG
jgi:hypothetical protein